MKDFFKHLESNPSGPAESIIDDPLRVFSNACHFLSQYLQIIVITVSLYYILRASVLMLNEY